MIDKKDFNLLLCIELLSYKGDIVLDSFMGSGTTAVVAKNLGRRYVGFEISPVYYRVAEANILNGRMSISTKNIDTQVYSRESTKTQCFQKNTLL